MKNLKIILGIAVIAAVMVITACPTEDDPDKTWTVTFDVNDTNASPVASQTVPDGGSVSKPYSFNKRTTPTAEGLYPANKKATWKNGTSTFDFGSKITANITLKATWTDEPKVSDTDLGTSAATIVEKAVTYINAHGDKYILALNNNVSNISTTQQITTGYADLEIIGLGAARTITFSGSSGALFAVGKNFSSATAKREVTTIALTLGNNITLAGKSGATESLVWVRNGAVLKMLTGSSITGNTTASTVAAEKSAGAIHVDNADFIMEGGSITGNTNSSNSYSSAGAIYIEDGSVVELKGGTINNNTCTSTKDIYATFTTTLKLSGSPTIGELTLSTNGAGSAQPTQNGVITLNSFNNGTVTKLNLRANSTTPASYWANKLILSGATASDITKFTLGSFITNTGTTTDINTTYKLATTGSIGTLVTK